MLSGLLMAVGVLVPRCGPLQEQQSLERWQRIQPQAIEQRIGLVGQIQPGTLSTLAAPFEANVLQKPAEEGQRVERGQLLLRLDTAQLQIQLREALAEQLKASSAVQELQGWETGQEMARARRALSSVRLNLADTERKLKETQGLLERGIVPRQEVDALQQQALTQRLDLKAAEAELPEIRKKGRGQHRQIADMQLTNAHARYEALLALQERRDIHAPFAGIVVRIPGKGSDAADKPVHTGARISQGQPLLGLANLEQLKVVAKVNEVDINQLREGQAVDISGDAFEGIALAGEITSVGTQAVEAEMSGPGATYEVTVALPSLTPAQQQRIRLGMSARLSIITYQNPTAMVVPPQAIEQRHGQHFVAYREDTNSPTQRIAVTVGKGTSGGVEITDLNPGYIRTDKPH